jgi:DNA-binding MarR family transcriptional regulator
MATPDPREQVQTLVLHMAALGSVLAARAAAVTKDPDVVESLPLLVLFSLDRDGPARPTALQEVTGLSSGGVTKLVERLEDKGLVRRRVGAVKGDRRGVLVELTRRGRQAARAIADAMASHLDDAGSAADELGRLLEA